MQRERDCFHFVFLINLFIFLDFSGQALLALHALTILIKNKIVSLKVCPANICFCHFVPCDNSNVNVLTGKQFYIDVTTLC